jgi:hypothetical protein
MAILRALVLITSAFMAQVDWPPTSNEGNAVRKRETRELDRGRGWFVVHVQNDEHGPQPVSSYSLIVDPVTTSSESVERRLGSAGENVGQAACLVAEFAFASGFSAGRKQAMQIRLTQLHLLRGCTATWHGLAEVAWLGKS